MSPSILAWARNSNGASTASHRCPASMMAAKPARTGRAAANSVDPLNRPRWLTRSAITAAVNAGSRPLTVCNSAIVAISGRPAARRGCASAIGAARTMGVRRSTGCHGRFNLISSVRHQRRDVRRAISTGASYGDAGDGAAAKCASHLMSVDAGSTASAKDSRWRMRYRKLPSQRGHSQRSDLRQRGVVDPSSGREFEIGLVPAKLVGEVIRVGRVDASRGFVA